MKIDVRSEESLYYNKRWTYYIDDSTNEQIIKKWKDGDERKNQNKVLITCEEAWQ